MTHIFKTHFFILFYKIFACVCEAGLERVIYISCGFEALERDTRYDVWLNLPQNGKNALRVMTRVLSSASVICVEILRFANPKFFTNCYAQQSFDIKWKVDSIVC